MPSTVNLVFSDAGTATKGDAEDGTSDFKVSGETVTIPAGQQSATVTLTGLQDDNEEAIENILISLALPESPTVALGSNTSLDIKIKDDEEPVVTFEASSNSISENGGEVILTANLSNAKLDPTVVSLALEGTATALEDYNVSSIYKYSSFVGKADEPGSRNGLGEAARFNQPTFLAKYMEGTTLLSDRVANTINLIDPSGEVRTVIGKAYQCGGDTGDVEEVRICDPMQIAVDSATGNIFWHAYRSIYGYNASDDQVSVIYDGQNDNSISGIGGIAFMNGAIYFTDRERHTLNKLTFNGSSFDLSQVAGVINSSKSNWDNVPRNFDEPAFHQPSYITPDPVNNRLIINTGYFEWNWDQLGRMYVVYFDTSTVTEMTELREMVTAAGNGYWPEFGQPTFDSFGSLYVPVTNFDAIIKVEFSDDGSFAGISRTINDDKLSFPVSVEINNRA